MTEQDTVEINWSAVFAGFIVDLGFSELVGTVAIFVMLALKGVELAENAPYPPDVLLVRNVVGVVGAIVGGVAAGWLARRWGALHGVMGNLLGLVIFVCVLPVLGSFDLNIGEVGFIVLNLIGAGYGGGVGERWRARIEGDA